MSNSHASERQSCLEVCPRLQALIASVETLATTEAALAYNNPHIARTAIAGAFSDYKDVLLEAIDGQTNCPGFRQMTTFLRWASILADGKALLEANEALYGCNNPALNTTEHYNKQRATDPAHVLRRYVRGK